MKKNRRWTFKTRMHSLFKRINAICRAHWATFKVELNWIRNFQCAIRSWFTCNNYNINYTQCLNKSLSISQCAIASESSDELCTIFMLIMLKFMSFWQYLPHLRTNFFGCCSWKCSNAIQNLQSDWKFEALIRMY